MNLNEPALLLAALTYEEGHGRRTQHILKVYALARMLGELGGLGDYDRELLQAAAILHDIPIKYCKEHFGCADQETQQQAAPELVRAFLEHFGYSRQFISDVTELVLKHHWYNYITSQPLQLLIEADLIVNCYEEHITGEKLESIRGVFKSEAGKRLLEEYAKGAGQ